MCLDQSLIKAFDTIREAACFDSHSLVPHPENLKFHFNALTVKATRAEPVRPFMQQSDLDGACGVHLAAMIVSIYGLAKPSALHEMGRRKFGLAAEIFSAFKHTYFTGVHAAEWVELFNGLHLPLQLTSKFGVEDTCERYTATALSRIEAGFRGKLIVRMDGTDFSLWLLLAMPQL